jgi:hypothetical protein
VKGYRTNDTREEYLQRTLGLPIDQQKSIMEVVHELRQAKRDLKDHQKWHIELREDHLNQLATAIVLNRSPSLLVQGKVQEFDRRRLKEIKHIQRKETMKRIYRKVGATLRPGSYTGLSRVDVPATKGLEPYPIGPDPKEWTGAWRHISDPTGIALHVSAMNARQYHQAHSTPFGSEPLLSYFGYRGDTSGAKRLIQGQLPPI